MEIYAEYSFWWAIPCLLLGFALSYLLYRTSGKRIQMSSLLRNLLMLLRTLVIGGLAFLLLGPFFKYLERQVQDPVILLLQDNSSSILLAPDSSTYRSDYIQGLSQLSERLGEEYEVKSYTFDKSLTDGLTIDYQGKQSDIGLALDEVLDRNINRNIGAVILATDGIYNRGMSPANRSLESTVPIYTVAMGDTTVKRDLLIENIAQNRLAYLGNDFPIEIQVKADKLKGRRTTLRVRKGGVELFSRTLDITDEDFLIEVPTTLNADAVGRQRYDVSLSVLEGELSEVNNFYSFYIDVLDSRQKILMLYAAPHPDVAAIRQAIESNENYEIALSAVRQFSGSLDGYDLLITHDLPQPKLSGMDLHRLSKDKGVPLWAIHGLGTDWNGVRKESPGFSIDLKGGDNTTEAAPALVREFGLFTLSDPLRNALQEWAPLRTAFADFSSEPGAKVLFEQRIGIVDTQQPLWIFQEIDGHRTARVLGEGLWRWRLQDFVEHDDHQRFNELISRTVQYLATKEDRRQFRVYGKERFDEDQNVILEGELYNESFEPINSSEVTATFTDSEGNSFEFVFSRTQRAYYLDAGRLPVGEYSYTARTDVGGETMRASGQLTVEAMQIEAIRTTADHQLLYRMSSSTGAAMFYPHQLDELAETLLSKEEIVPMIYTSEQMRDLIDSRWLLFLFVALLAIEWFVRKYKGGY